MPVSPITSVGLCSKWANVWLSSAKMIDKQRDCAILCYNVSERWLWREVTLILGRRYCIRGNWIFWYFSRATLQGQTRHTLSGKRHESWVMPTLLKLRILPKGESNGEQSKTKWNSRYGGEKGKAKMGKSHLDLLSVWGFHAGHISYRGNFYRCFDSHQGLLTYY